MCPTRGGSSSNSQCGPESGGKGDERAAQPYPATRAQAGFAAQGSVDAARAWADPVQEKTISSAIPASPRAGNRRALLLARSLPLPWRKHVYKDLSADDSRKCGWASQPTI